MKSHKLSVLEKVGFGSGDMAVNVVISSMFLIITYFYTDVFGLKPTDVATLFLLVRFVDAVADPLMGILTDRFTTRWGRYRHYFLFLAIPFGVSIVLTFTTPHFSYAGKLIWAYATYNLVMLMFTAVTIPYISLIGVLTDSPQERLSANGYRLFFAKVSAFLVAIVVPVMAQKWGAGSVSAGYQLAMGLMATIAAALFLFCFATTTERVQHVVDKKPLALQLKYLVKNDQFMVLCGVCVLGTLGYVIRNSVAAYYAKYFLKGDEQTMSSFMGTGVIAAILAMVASTWITKRFCKVALFRWSQILVAVISAVMFFVVKPGDRVLAFTLYFALSFVVDLHAPVFWSALAEAVDYGEHKNKERVSGLAYGGISFCQKASMGLAGAVVGWLLEYYDYIPDQVQNALTLQGIALMLTIIPGAFHFGMGLLMFRYRITDKFYKDMLSAKDGSLPAKAEAAS